MNKIAVPKSARLALVSRISPIHDPMSRYCAQGRVSTSRRWRFALPVVPVNSRSHVPPAPLIQIRKMYHHAVVKLWLPVILTYEQFRNFIFRGRIKFACFPISRILSFLIVRIQPCRRCAVVQLCQTLYQPRATAGVGSRAGFIHPARLDWAGVRRAGMFDGNAAPACSAYSP